jgi:two-component system, sensor histidine kinase and response regulator
LEFKIKEVKGSPMLFAKPVKKSIQTIPLQVLFLVFFLFVTFLFFSLLFAQTNNQKFHKISIEHGLSQSSANCILQDQRGFMWFGTQDGLNRYDGYNFKIYRNNPEDPSSISDKHIRSLYEDKSGNIWIGTWMGGLNCYNRNTDSFTSYKHNKNNPNSLSHNLVEIIFPESDSLLWIGTKGGGLNQFNISNGLFKHYKYNPKDSYSLSSDNITCIYKDSKDFIWIGTDLGLNRLDKSTNTFIRYMPVQGDSQSISHFSITAILEDHQKNLWIGTEKGINQFDYSNDNFTRNIHQIDKNIKLNNASIRSIFQDSNNNLWFGTDADGLILYDYSKNDFVLYRNNPYDQNSLGDINVLDICEDKSGVIWFGTHGTGVNWVAPIKEQFELFQQKIKSPNSLSYNDVWSIYEDPAEKNSILWICTNGGGLNRFDKGKNQFTQLRHDPNNPNSIIDDRVVTVIRDHSNNLWIGTKNGLNKFNPKTKRFTSYQFNPDDPHSLSNNVVYTLHEDKERILWVGTENGLNKFLPKENKFIRYYADESDINSIIGNNVRDILEDQDGILWIGTLNGLSKLNLQYETFTSYKHDINDPNSLSNDKILSLYINSSNILWICTVDGLNRYNKKSQKFDRFSTQNGLANNLVYGLLEDKKSNLWISSNNGISKFNPITMESQNYNQTHGLQSNEFNFAAFCKSKNGEMFFGGINGLNSFHPENIKDNTFIPPVTIIDFKIANKSVPIGEDENGRCLLTKHITETEEITLSYSDRVLTFEFSTLNFIFPEKNKYAYILEGFEDTWNYVDDKRYATYTNLRPGNYKFRVKGSNNDSIWNEIGTSLKITISPPIWKTWWFKGIGILSLFIAIITIYQIRTRSIRIKNKKLEQRVKERTSDLQKEINERKFAEKEIEKRQQYLESVLFNTPSAIITLDHQKMIKDWNPGAELLFQYSQDEVLGKSIDEIISLPDDKEEVTKYTQKVLAIEQIPPTEIIRQRKDGNLLNLILAASPIHINEKLYGVVVVYTDITQQKQTETALFEAKEAAEAATVAKSQFLANMSHEIRTPMNGVMGMTDLLLDTQLTDEQREFSEIVKSSADNLLTVINDILDFSKIESGKLELEKIDFDLRKSLEDIADVMALKANEKGIELANLVYNDVPALLQGDPGRLRQVIINLANNAIKFTPQGEVVLRTRLIDETNSQASIQISVSDTGIGIPKDRVNRLFQSFSQVDASTTRKYGGTGLGLAISKQLIEMMGGTINVESKEGKGSTFYFEIALTKQSEPKEIRLAAIEEIRSQRILIVDDNQINRLVLKEQLQSWGCQYDEAVGGTEALEKLYKAYETGNPFDIVLSDMMMPEMDGEMLGRIIKGDEKLKKTILFVLTSVGERGDAARLKEIGFAAYFTKPVKQSQLYDCLATVVNCIDQRQEKPSQPIITKHSLADASKKQVQILLAEDNITNQMVAVRILNKLGYKADVVENGKLAVEALQSKHYNLVLMDVQMPEMDGFEATKAIRESTDVCDSNIPIVAMTAHAMKGDREKCLEKGMNDYISKPINPQQLLTVINKQLSKLPTRGLNTEKENKSQINKIFDRSSLEKRIGDDPEFVNEVLEIFLEDLQEQFDKLKDSVKNKNIKTLTRTAHSIKGASQNMGAISLSEVASEMEKNARRNEITLVDSALVRMEKEITKFKTTILETN